MWQDLAIDPASLLAGILAGMLVGAGLAAARIMRLEKDKAGLIARAEAERGALDEHFQALARRVLDTNSESFLTLAQERLKSAQDTARHDLDKRSLAIEQMVAPVRKGLEQLSGSLEQLHGTKKALHDELKSLSQETARLSGAMRNPAARGKWGEFILERLLDKAGMIKGVHYDTQVKMAGPEGERLQPDVVIRLHDGFNIVVDAKTPLNEFVDRFEEDMDESTMADLRTRLAQKVKERITDLGRKSYWENLDSPDFVAMFLPSEHLFSEAMRADPSLMDYAAERRVVITSPVLMMSLLRVVGMSWRQVELAKNAQEIADLGADLYDRISVFSGHMEKVGKGMESALGAYNKAVSSLESRVLVSARKFRDMRAASGTKEIGGLPQIETTARTLSATQDKDIAAE